MIVWMQFLTAITPVLWDLFRSIQDGKPNIEAERELALRVIRAAKDAAARSELGG